MTENIKRITIFAGHYGSGKTNIAVNYAVYVKDKLQTSVSLADLDIVNPYYRAKDSTDILEEKGIRMISSPFANSNVDLPAMPSEAYAIIDDKSTYAVCDVGGDDRGAYALGRYREGILSEDYEMLLVINKYRPLTKEIDDLIQIKNEIEETAGIAFTGIVNNSNLGLLTSPEDVEASFEYASIASEKTGLPIKFTAVWEKIYPALSEKYENIMPLALQKRDFW
ncbi:MAG: hypothetical protein ACI4GZ_05850 [Ruminococcus sp.]